MKSGCFYYLSRLNFARNEKRRAKIPLSDGLKKIQQGCWWVNLLKLSASLMVWSPTQHLVKVRQVREPAEVQSMERAKQQSGGRGSGPRSGRDRGRGGYHRHDGFHQRSTLGEGYPPTFSLSRRKKDYASEKAQGSIKLPPPQIDSDRAALRGG